MLRSYGWEEHLTYLIYSTYVKKQICLSFSLFLMHRTHFSADLDQSWHVIFLSPKRMGFLQRDCVTPPASFTSIVDMKVLLDRKFAIPRPAPKQFHLPHWRPLETCCQPWTLDTVVQRRSGPRHCWRWLMCSRLMGSKLLVFTWNGTWKPRLSQ